MSAASLDASPTVAGLLAANESLRAELALKDAELEEKDAAIQRHLSDISKLNKLLRQTMSGLDYADFMNAVRVEDVEAIKKKMAKGFELIVDELDFRYRYGEHEVHLAPLSWACAENKPKSVEALLAGGAYWDAKNGDCSTALHWAVSMCPAAVPMLLAKGASVEAVNEIGDRPLHLAATVEAARALVEAGADVNSRNEERLTPLLSASFAGRKDVVRFLLEQRRTNVNAKDCIGRGVIHHAAEGRMDDVIKIVLAHPGVDPMAVDSKGNTTLHLAALYSSSEVITSLLPHFADVNINNKNNRSPLSEMLKRNTLDLNNAIALLEAGAKVKSSAEERLLVVLRPLLLDLYRNPKAPLPFYRRTLRWAMTSPLVEAALPSIRAEAAAAAPASAGAGSTAALPADIDDTKALRLALWRQDAFERRKYLVFDREMTIREAERDARSSRKAQRPVKRREAR